MARSIDADMMNTALPLCAGMAWCAIDDTGCIVLWRGEVNRLLGCEQADFVGKKTLLSFLVEVDSLDQIIDETVVMQHVDQDSVSLVHIHIAEMSNEATDLQWYLLRDVTEETTGHMGLEEQAFELTRAMDTIDEAMLLLDLSGRINTSNAQARSWYGAGGLQGRSVYSSVRRPDEPPVNDIVQECLSTFEVVTVEQYLATRNRTVEVSVYPMMDHRKGNLRQLLFLERDITQRRLMELEIRQQQRRLEDNLVRLRELDETRSHWVNSVSHELRTPLTSICSFSENLLTYPHMDKEQREEFVGIIHKESNRLARLINDLLDLASAESGALHVRPSSFDLCNLVGECLNALRPLADKERITLRLMTNHKHLHCVLDRDRVQQIIINLVSNGIKFSPSDSSIFILLDADEEEVRIAVEDDGPGIPAADRLQVFDRFTQLTTNLTNKPGGTGLGLTISQQWAEAMTGSIRCVEARMHSGARFLVTLPRQLPLASSQD